MRGRRQARKGRLAAVGPSHRTHGTDRTLEALPNQRRGRRHARPVAANLLDRRFAVDSGVPARVGDITCIQTKRGWLNLATVITLATRQWSSLSTTPNASFTAKNRSHRRTAHQTPLTLRRCRRRALLETVGENLVAIDPQCRDAAARLVADPVELRATQGMEHIHNRSNMRRYIRLPPESVRHG